MFELSENEWDFLRCNFGTSNTPENDEADILGLLLDEDEKKHYPIDAPDPIEAIKIRMEEMQLKQKDLALVIGSRSRVSDVLNRKRKLTVEMIRKLNRQLNISPNILINSSFARYAQRG